MGTRGPCQCAEGLSLGKHNPRSAKGEQGDDKNQCDWCVFIGMRKEFGFKRNLVRQKGRSIETLGICPHTIGH